MTDQLPATPAIPSASAARRPLIRRLYVALGVISILLLAGLFIWGLVVVGRNFGLQVEVIRDLFIIVLALESCLFGIALLIMLVMLIRLVNTVEFEIKPILQKTNETVSTVRGTTQFISQNLVRPTITASSYVAGVRQGVKTLFGDPKRNLPD